MSRHLERLLHLDQQLRSRSRQTCETLADALEVSPRTVRSDLNFLRDRFSAPLEWSKTHGWYYTDTDWRLPSISLSQGELFALTLGARMLEAYAGSAHEGLLQSAIARLSERLPEPVAINLHQLAQERVQFRAGGEIILDPQIWTDLIQACTQSQQVWMRYYSPKSDETSERTIDPYVLDVYRGSNPYLWAYCHLRQEIRSFRVDRIRELVVTSEPFERDPDFDLKTVLGDSFQYQVGGDPVDVAIWFDEPTARYITERKWHSSQRIETHCDRSITLHLKVTGLEDVKRWVLGYGRGAVVQHPPELVALMREEAAILNEQYRLGVETQ
ncbi:WYL domain-containing protein [Spirulina sp. CS-785/01]|uniref:helix-turn-helix transcriptional regulator n=1 Tax=Spirulina sp. CS-785/01 TaxID=3021716 RepID=UPI00232C5965|nr:WYL domain-containing protein [Spirulina sp. CS-785/01]MDB9311785.1 WYL domain-containing protein [Spirulina sp. CS-785/01]